MHDRTALLLVSIRLYMYGILTSVFTDTEALCLILGMHWPSGSKPLRSLLQIVRTVKMVENGGILATNHNLKYYKILLSPLVAKT